MRMCMRERRGKKSLSRVGERDSSSHAIFLALWWWLKRKKKKKKKRAHFPSPSGFFPLILTPDSVNFHSLLSSKRAPIT